MAKKETKKAKNYWHFYGAKLTQNGEMLNVSIVRGEDDEREFENVYIPINNETNVNKKCRARVFKDEKYCLLRLPFFEENKAKEPLDIENPF